MSRMAPLGSVLLFMASALTAWGQSQAICPWVASGTAERLLGGEVTIAVHVDENAAGTCRFVRRSNQSNVSIEILVGPVDTHACPPGSVQLKALSNEAVQCRFGAAASQTSDRVTGRIRKTFFVVTITGVPGDTKPEPSDPRLVSAYAASPLERLAEQVVGNLY